MKNSFIKELSTDELVDRIAEEKNLYSKLRINHSVSPVENPMKVRTARKLIARLQTELRNRQLNETQKA